jgi:hypothetical protein
MVDIQLKLEWGVMLSIVVGGPCLMSATRSLCNYWMTVS